MLKARFENEYQTYPRLKLKWQTYVAMYQFEKWILKTFGIFEHWAFKGSIERIMRTALARLIFKGYDNIF